MTILLLGFSVDDLDTLTTKPPPALVKSELIWTFLVTAISYAAKQDINGRFFVDPQSPPERTTTIRETGCCPAEAAAGHGYPRSS
ncbi:hypothetical protein CWR43_32545 [Rhizobium sullae]|uniref:Uncharacterized protein n=1 Tax=Rhizobium sullae TaxID=50338 RepID=A0A2N0D068_RHISU|nr:hypothetical protein [Rhizobium sullae]PKA39505.1 hypothetical protein CWR43_32545 [Rhizobium sullae]